MTVSPTARLRCGADGRKAAFGLMVDCHFEVEEIVTVTDAVSGEVLRTESNQRDHIWTFMTRLDGGVISRRRDFCCTPLSV